MTTTVTLSMSKKTESELSSGEPTDYIATMRATPLWAKQGPVSDRIDDWDIGPGLETLERKLAATQKLIQETFSSLALSLSASTAVTEQGYKAGLSSLKTALNIANDLKSEYRTERLTTKFMRGLKSMGASLCQVQLKLCQDLLRFKVEKDFRQDSLKVYDVVSDTKTSVPVKKAFEKKDHIGSERNDLGRLLETAIGAYLRISDSATRISGPELYHYLDTLTSPDTEQSKLAAQRIELAVSDPSANEINFGPSLSEQFRYLSNWTASTEPYRGGFWHYMQGPSQERLERFILQGRLSVYGYEPPQAFNLTQTLPEYEETEC